MAEDLRLSGVLQVVYATTGIEPIESSCVISDLYEVHSSCPLPQPAESSRLSLFSTGLPSARCCLSWTEAEKDHLYECKALEEGRLKAVEEYLDGVGGGNSIEQDDDDLMEEDNDGGG